MSAYRDAQRNLGYTKVKAPVDGRVGIISVTVGNFVNSISGPLTTITSSNPMYVTFPLDSKDFVELTRVDGAANVPREVDFIFRFTPLEWLKDIKPKNWGGYFDTVTPSCNHPVAIFAQTKRFPLIWDILEKNGINATIINPKFATGIDKELIKIAKKDRYDMVVTNEPVMGFLTRLAFAEKKRDEGYLYCSWLSFL